MQDHPSMERLLGEQGGEDAMGRDLEMLEMLHIACQEGF